MVVIIELKDDYCFEEVIIIIIEEGIIIIIEEGMIMNK